MRIKQQSLLPFSLEQFVMNGKPLDRKAFEKGHTHATLKRQKIVLASLERKSNATPNGNLTRDLSVA